MYSHSFEADHKTPLANGGGNDIGNIDLKCLECHKNKSQQESISGYGNIWYSQLNADVCDGILHATKTKQIVCGDGSENNLEFDTKGCRDLRNCTVDLPQANILDDIKPYKNRTEFADLVCVDAGNTNCSNYLHHVIYPGPGWTNWENAMFILDNNITSEKKILQKKISLQFSKHQRELKKKQLLRFIMKWNTHFKIISIETNQ